MPGRQVKQPRLIAYQAENASDARFVYAYPGEATLLSLQPCLQNDGHSTSNTAYSSAAYRRSCCPTYSKVILTDHQHDKSPGN